MIAKVFLRKATQDDLAWISEIPDISWTNANLINELHQAEDSLFFVDTQNRGFCCMRRIDSEGHIMNLGVVEGHRRKGVGKKLVEKSLLAAQTVWNSNTCIIEYAADDLPLKTFYEGLGFTPIGVRKNYYKDGRDAIMAERKLGNEEEGEGYAFSNRNFLR